MCAAEGCTDPAVSSRGECSGKFTNQNGREEQRYWECLQYRAEPASYNYDNAWQAFLCTFQVRLAAAAPLRFTCDPAIPVALIALTDGSGRCSRGKIGT